MSPGPQSPHPQTNPRKFYLKLPHDPGVLPYPLVSRYYLGTECTVDTSYLPCTRVTYLEGIQVTVVPFNLFLLHELQVWDNQWKAEEAPRRAKRLQDAADGNRVMTH
jgi:hypothetical protein